MSFDNENKPFSPKEEEDDDSRSGTSSGGQIEFRTFVGNERSRDDLLPPDERKRLLIAHQTLNESNVKKQKARFDEYQRLKEGKTSLQEFRQSKQPDFPFKPHAILANKAQFSGMDKPVNPTEIADTNNDKKNELHYQYRLENRPQYTNAPRATPPKPSPFH